MRGKKFGALVLAAALTVASVRCFGLSAAAEEEKASAGITVSENDLVAVTAETENDLEDVAAVPGNNLMAASNERSTTQLAAPTDLAWGDNYEITYKPADVSHSSYEVELYKDNVLVTSISSSNRAGADGIIKDTCVWREIEESGTYKLRVKAVPAWDDTTHTESDWTAYLEKTYNRPSNQLGTTTAVWDAEKAGQINFKLVANEAIYYAHIYKDGQSKGSTAVNAVTSGKPGEIVSMDLSSAIAQYGEGKYTVRMRAMSTDLDTIAHGEEGSESAVYDTSKKASDLSDILTNAMESQTAAGAVETLTTSADADEIQEAMQTSDSFRGQVEELEKKYITEKSITAGTEVSEAAEKYVNTDKVKVVGAALNAAGGSVKLNIDVTPEDKKVSLASGYLKNVQLDIKLVGGSTEIHELKIPVSVTIPVPAGIDVRQLAILHYHQDGTVERVVFHVNGDGTVTFTVKDFSTFVFAEETADSDGGKENDAADNNGSNASNGSGCSNGTGGNQDVVKNMIQSAGPMSVITITKEQKINALSNAAMQMLLKRGDVTLVMEYVYQGKEYHIVIPAGKAEDNDIPWYGPLYLAAYYSDYGIPGEETDPAAKKEEEYIVKKGDTLGAIGRARGMTPGQIAKMNPQIKDVNVIRVGEKIKLK